MRKFAAIFVVFFVQCTHLYSLAQARAEPDPGVVEYLKQSCVYGNSSYINVYLYNSRFQGKNLGNQQSCQDINASLPVVFITHGFTSSAQVSTFKDLANAFVQKGHTAFIVDWSEAACTDGLPGVQFAEYNAAASNTYDIGQLMAKYTVDLMNKCKIPLNNIQYVGHSLGSHVCGFAAKHVKKLINKTMPYILALDPADPSFGSNKCGERICKSDAKRIVVFKTSILGIGENIIGHLLIVFDGGKSQPACSWYDVPCSHSESIVYATGMVSGRCQHLAVPWTAQQRINPIQWKFWRVFTSNIPAYPTSDTTNCVVLNTNVFKNDNTFEGEYHAFPDCARNLFKCRQQ
ncbi:phospholipase A1 precursor [Solenopsis invicta]|uniref:Phospholipase A1 n=1 Tax=Solenopsis invicta TaxID=13686 RepID=PA1_SOLIN|nr:phospholipase A1 precursor [Solenopsis invicta]Q68KK0.1 RecName: Full=Phospholipase A1; Short=PLA1; AltName: Full=Allergen Sol i I; AltName: Full=Venom allergen 1; AltName: Full=Venom allergen I; AltName: Allergen=Sol i 1; Flags: Precursor [Solenopsis invicta]AAT95008.1 allergen Sol i 1 precursor [Solenopsis invicta]